MIDGPTKDAINSANLAGLYTYQGYGFEESSATKSQLNSTCGYVEQAGNTSLYKMWGGGCYAISDYTWNSIDFTDDDGWSIVGAEQVNNVNQLVFENSISGEFYIHNNDRYWNYVSGDWLTGVSFYQAESDFGQDFNKDFVIGGGSYTTIESQGNVELQKDSSGMGWVKLSNGSRNDITYGGQRVGDGSFAGWSQVAAETINGQNKVIWTHSNGSMSEWNVDANWNHVSDTVHAAGSTAYLGVESDFQMDFNGNGVIGGSTKISGISNNSILSDINRYLSDDLFSHQELKSILDSVANGGVTTTELADLQIIESNLSRYLTATDASYHSYIFDAVVNGNSANQWWTGGQSSRTNLGNLYAGSSEYHLDLLVDKWYGGLDRPTNFVEGDSAAGLGVLSFDYYEMVGDLFVDGVNFVDVNQGQAGTCYLLAAASSFADADPSIITEMFRDNGDGTYGVRFYDNSLSEIWVTVDSYVPSTDGYYRALAGNSSWGLTGEKWVALLEKAYAQANETGAFYRAGDSDLISKNSYAAVEGGWMDALIHLSGNTTTTVSFNYTGTGGTGVGMNDWSNAYGSYTSWNAFENQAIAAVNSGKALWLSSFGDTWDWNGRQSFVAKHVFAITDYDYYTGSFTFVNPWTPSNTHNQTFTARWSELATLGIDPTVSWA